MKRIILLITVVALCLPVWSQNIYVTGIASQKKLDEFHKVIALIDQHCGYKKLIIQFHNGTPIYYNKKKTDSKYKLDKALQEYVEYSRSLTFEDVQSFKRLIPFYNKPIVTFSRNAMASNYMFNSISSMLTHIKSYKPKEKFDLVFDFTSVKPRISITSPVSNSKYDGYIQGICEGEDIVNVLLRIDGGPWITINNNQQWKYKANQTQANQIEAIAINAYGDTSDIVKSDNLINRVYTAKDIVYVSPNGKQSALTKCKGYKFVYRFQAASGMVAESINIIIEDVRGQTVYNSSLGDFPAESMQIKKRGEFDEYCLFLIYSILSSKYPHITPCNMREEPFVMRLQYINGDGTKTSTPPINISYSSFNDDYYTKYPDCDCQ